jgi:hypothetical protein
MSHHNVALANNSLTIEPYKDEKKKLGVDEWIKMFSSNFNVHQCGRRLYITSHKTYEKSVIDGDESKKIFE